MKKNILALIVLLLPGILIAQDAADEEEGYRIYYIGNSLTDELKYDSFEDLAATRGHKVIWGRHMIPGAAINWLWDHIEDGFRTKYGYPKEAFSKYKWDAITMQPFQG
ncbi:MAG: hypothetical protein ACLFUS_06540 [Candidatus Sumerlaeia bacterium]